MLDLVPLHVVAGSVALLAGTVALIARKGAWTHRKAGLAFVITMLLMSASGGLIALAMNKTLSMVAAVLTFYLVLTAWLTVHRPTRGGRLLDWSAMSGALLLGTWAVLLGYQALQSTNGTIDGQPAQVAVVFGFIALLAASLDGRMLAAGGAAGRHRLLRHLWRMCLALLIAMASFFLGQAQVFPEAMQSLALLSLPVLGVLLLMIFWIGRVLLSRRYRSLKPKSA